MESAFYSQLVHEGIPIWVQELQTGGDFEDNITVMRIHLGTGETMAKVFPVYGNFSLQTGRLFSENKDALILEVENPTSSYGAANILVD